MTREIPRVKHPANPLAFTKGNTGRECFRLKVTARRAKATPWLQDGQQMAAPPGLTAHPWRLEALSTRSVVPPRTDSGGALPSLGNSGMRKAAPANPSSGAARRGDVAGRVSRTERSGSSLPLAPASSASDPGALSPMPLELIPDPPCPVQADRGSRPLHLRVPETLKLTLPAAHRVSRRGPAPPRAASGVRGGRPAQTTPPESHHAPWIATPPMWLLGVLPATRFC